MEETISLKELLEILKKRFLLIVSITLIAAVVSGIVSYFFITPIYQASTQILVNQAKSDQTVYNPGEVQTNLQLINTYNVIIKSPVILDKVSQELNMNMTAEQLNGKITVSNETNSQVVNIAVQDPNPTTAANIANTTAAVFKSQISSIMKVDNVTILAKANVGEDPSPIKPRKALNVAIAAVIGLMASVGISFLLEYFNNTIKNEQDVETTLELPILGTIAHIDDQKLNVLRRQRATGRGESFGA